MPTRAALALSSSSWLWRVLQTSTWCDFFLAAVYFCSSLRRLGLGMFRPPKSVLCMATFPTTWVGPTRMILHEHFSNFLAHKSKQNISSQTLAATTFRRVLFVPWLKGNMSWLLHLRLPLKLVPEKSATSFHRKISSRLAVSVRTVETLVLFLVECMKLS